MGTILVRCHGEIQSLDRSWESQVLQRTAQVKWITGKMVFGVTRLWLHTVTYSRKDKYQGRCFIKEESSWYHKRQSKCANA